MMTLGEFRELTAALPADLELLCAGGSVSIVWHSDEAIGIDDTDDLDFDPGEGAVILFSDLTD